MSKHNACFGVLLLASLLTISTTLPAHSQDSFDSPTAEKAKVAPCRGDAFDNNTVAPLTQPDPNAIRVSINPGSIRVNMLANLEALINMGANGTEIIGILWGAILLIFAARRVPKGQKARLALYSLIPISLGLSAPGAISWLVSLCRDNNFFS